MSVFSIIFWVVIIETVLGHLPLGAPFLALAACLVVDLISRRHKKKVEDKLKKSVDEIIKRRDKK